MKFKTLTYTASLVLTLCSIHNASAFPDFLWTDTSGDNQWNNPNNWTNLDNATNGLPENDPSQTGAVQVDPVNGSSVCVIPTGYTVDLGYETPGAPLYNTLFGPEQGENLNVFGTLKYNWTVAPYSPNPAVRSIINMYNGSFMTTQGASINLGDAWWSGIQFGNHSTMNMYGNSQFASIAGAGWWFGAHLNLYDTSSFLANGYVNMDIAFGESDGTRSIVMGGGTLLVPEGTITGAGNSGSAGSWITRGMLRAYGKGYDTNDLLITDNGTNTIIVAAPLGGSLARVYFQPLLMSTVNVGTFQQASLVGDYPSVSGVLLSSAEPGLSPGSFTHPVYNSSNPSVATVDTNGVVTAVGLGSSTLTATVGAFNSTNSVTLTVVPVVPALAHEYKFNESPGSTTTADAVGGATGTVNGDATFTGSGQLVLSGNLGSSVSLPAGILSGLNQVTIETWVTFPGAINAFANLFAFGGTDLSSPLSATFGEGENYLTFSPHTGGLTTQANFGQGLPGNQGEWDAVLGGVLDNQTNVHVVVVYNPYAGSESVYLNGSLAVSQTMYNTLTDPVAYVGPTFTNGSIIPLTLGADPLNYIGQSLYAGNPNVTPAVPPDPGLLANIDEFRIYSNALTSAQIAADHALGPNHFIGANTNVKLQAALTGDPSIVISWPTNSALVNLVSSPVLGSGAVWTSAVNGSLAVVGTNYSITLPTVPSSRFFRLTQ
jgi:Concanavalin A-like lectin/glucanases superfamily/Bacterial Ig-like domain (group 2)